MSKKILSVLLAALLIFSLAACGEQKNTQPAEEKQESRTPEFEILYNDDDYVVGLEYEGLNMSGLDSANIRFGSEKYASEDIKPAGCSITFAKYINGYTGAVRNMDLQMSQYCSYEFKVFEGENTKYPFWGLSYIGTDEKSYKELLDQGLSNESYNMIPFLATDTMNFGRDAKGNRASLYSAVLMRAAQYDYDNNNKKQIWACTGTYPGAEIRCCTQSLPTLFASQCISIDEVLKMTGAIDEQYRRLFPNTEPTLDVYTFNSELSNWLEVVALEDSTGRHGVLEFIDNYAIWHEGVDYSFNYFLQEDYLYNEDGTYKEQYGAGIGRYEATVPYLDKIHTVSDHVALMDGIRYSFLTYYHEGENYIGYDYEGNPVDWRSEEAGADPFGMQYTYRQLGLDTSVADEKYPLWANYIDKNTGELIRINSLEEYGANYDHIRVAWTMNYVQDDANYEEVMNYIRWNGLLFNNLTLHERAIAASGWETYFKVVCSPMECIVTRWFNEDINTAGTVSWKDMVNE